MRGVSGMRVKPGRNIKLPDTPSSGRISPTCELLELRLTWVSYGTAAWRATLVYPFLPERAAFWSTLNNGVLLPVFGIFNTRTNVDASTAHGGGCTSEHRREVCTESWLWKKNPMSHRGVEPASEALSMRNTIHQITSKSSIQRSRHMSVNGGRGQEKMRLNEPATYVDLQRTKTW